ncbi:thioredoxin reductase [Endomicrobiia bacterium]|nr:thioredoxin reductase [Endomicrobiia bacterium]GHT19925.1 thioredoxin reductase [Endomicrobiia bacterium]GHT19927.1 thioredoxin reductase [Endomicrobiia bacterium]GHT26476.1 thioredoxin reductase [Endomicrobiia bacterium]GHT31179.1 thioredoxin reductase [Endomicrobiia bacterium]
MIYDVIIIGGGPAGLSAAIYASRARLKTLIIEKTGCGGQMTTTDLLENYPGFNGGINGFELAVKLEKQARDFGAEIIYDEVGAIEQGLSKKVITANSAYETKTVIIAAGTYAKKMNIPGESEFMGRGVSFCAVCDAPFYRDKNVLVVGGGDSAIEEAAYISKFAKNVTVVHRRDKLRAAKILQERMKLHPNISVIYDSVPKEIFGSDSVEKVTITNVKTNESKDLIIDGVFVFTGLIPNTLFLSGVALDKTGYIITDEDMNTSSTGIFACGDIRKKQLRQVVTAASDGAQAAVSAQRCIENL